MAVDVITTLEQLRFISVKNAEARTEPYIWPVVLKVDDSTLAGVERDDRVQTLVPALGNARVVIKNSMRVGETADIPNPVSTFRVRFEDFEDGGLHVRQLILCVALFEMDETPLSAVKAGFQAFASELGKQISLELLALGDANEEQEKAILEDIKIRVGSRVRSAIENDLTGWEKTKIFTGTLDLDEFIATGFTKLIEQNFVVPKRFSLVFEGREVIRVGDIKIEGSSKYEIQGQLQVRPIVVERCQPQINAVNAAQTGVNDIEQEIRNLQAQLSGEGEEEQTLPKDFINAEIERLKGELDMAMEILKDAHLALKGCRLRQGLVGGFGEVGVATA